METSPLKISINSNSEALNQNIDISHIRDEQLPKILFLATRPKKIEIPSFIKQSYRIRNPERNEKIKYLTDKFEKCLKNKDIGIIRRTLHVRLITLQRRKNSSVSRTVPKRNFSDDWDFLSQEEEDTLEFKVIFQVLSIKIPDFLEHKFNKIAQFRKIDINVQDGECQNTYFMSPEKKVISEICDMLNNKDVFRLYKTIKKDEDQDFINDEEETMFLTTNEALKNVAFYFIIINMINAKRLNRVDTRTLENSLLKVKNTYLAENEIDLNRFDLALRKLGKYPISSNPPGICIIFCMEFDRRGSGCDLKKVKELFGKIYKYHVIYKKDPTSHDVEEIAEKLNAPRYEYYDSLIVWFMGHGSLDSLLMMDKAIDCRYFLELFASRHRFYKKPKLLFIQSCRNKKPATTPENLKSYEMFMIKDYADTLVSYATKWEENAARNCQGSLYVQTVVDQLKMYGHRQSIENVLRKIHYNTNSISLLSAENKTWKQTPYYESSLQKEFIFPTPE